MAVNRQSPMSAAIGIGPWARNRSLIAAAMSLGAIGPSSSGRSCGKRSGGKSCAAAARSVPAASSRAATSRSSGTSGYTWCPTRTPRSIASIARRMSILRSLTAKFVSDRITPSSSSPSDPSTSSVTAFCPAAPM